MPARKRPARLLVRLRHPDGKMIKSATVNGQNWLDFDPRKEWIRIENPDQARYAIVSSY
jgi:hypothetical protein